jgi:plastocyanin
MKTRYAVWILGSAVMTLLCPVAAIPAAVTVNIRSSGALSPEDTVVVFDPMDAIVPPAHIAATIDQIDKQFVPRVSVLRTGTTVTFTNSDRVRHQVYSFSPSKTFALKLYAGSPEAPIVFDKSGLVVLGCNIHDRMIAFVAIVDSPYFAKVPSSGTVSMNLPAGRYRLRVWHPSLVVAVPPQQIAVSATPLDIPLTLDLSINAPGVAPWPE